MEVGINRSKIDIKVAKRSFTIGIVPLMATSLIAKHDNEKDVDKQIEIAFEVVEAVLVANNYEYDREWWEKHCDYSMIMEFILFTLQKDIPPTKSKKKAVVESN
jgi:hypothetical protein